MTYCKHRKYIEHFTTFHIFYAGEKTVIWQEDGGKFF